MRANLAGLLALRRLEEQAQAGAVLPVRPDDDADHGSAGAGQDSRSTAAIAANPCRLQGTLRIELTVIADLHADHGEAVQDESRLPRDPGERVARIGDSSHDTQRVHSRCCALTAEEIEA